MGIDVREISEWRSIIVLIVFVLASESCKCGPVVPRKGQTDEEAW